jgi:hypothetical protein
MNHPILIAIISVSCVVIGYCLRGLQVFWREAREASEAWREAREASEAWRQAMREKDER